MQILILGAGYAGLRVAIELGRLLEGRKDPPQVTLVDQHPYHQHVALLHRIATGIVDEHEAVLALNKIVRDQFVQVCQGRVAHIDPVLRLVVLEDERVLPYDRLVIALGAQADDGGVPGANTYTLPLRTYTQALDLRDHILECFRAAAQTSDPADRRILLTFAIVGGGFIGCQFAGELAGTIGDLSRQFNVPRKEVRVALIESDHRLLRPYGDWAHNEALSVLDRRLVSVYLNMPVKRVEEEALCFSEDRLLRAATIVWTTGIRAPALLAKSGLTTMDDGRLLVDSYLRVEGQEMVFAAGDCAYIRDPRGGTVLSTASYAMRQGEYLAKLFVAELEERTPPAYEPLRLGHLVSLGPGKGVGDPLGMPISGRVASLLKQGVEKWYLTTLD